VLLCSGTVANPQLLTLSGIGPEASLRDLGLPVVAASEGVGANLQDHPATLYAAQTKPEYQVRAAAAMRQRSGGASA
jgi:choline dehydrogenase